MKLNYYSDTDSLYIDLSVNKSVDSKEVLDGVVIDYDSSGAITGIDIDNASKILNLKELTTSNLPVQKQAILA